MRVFRNPLEHEYPEPPRVSAKGEGAPAFIPIGVSAKGGVVGFRSDQPDHMFVAGITRSGKTTFIKHVILSGVRSGAGFTYATGKPTDEVLNTLWYIAKQCGRETDFYVLNVNNPAKTMRWDPLFGHSTEEQAQIVKSLLSNEYFTGGAVYYTEMGTSFLQPVLSLLKATGGRYTLLDLQAFLVDPWAFMDLIAKEGPKGSGESGGTAAKEFEKCYAVLRNELLRYRTDRTRQRDLEQSFDSLSHNIRFLTSPPYDAVFAPDVPDFTVLDCLQHNAILAVCLGALGHEDISMRAGRAWMASTKAATGHILNELTERKVDPVTYLALDEFGSYAIPEAAVMFEQCREARIRLIVSIQTIERLMDPNMRLSPVFLKTVFENCRIKVFLKLGMYSGRIAEEYYGKRIRQFKTVSVQDQRSDTFSFRMDNALSQNKAFRRSEGLTEREAPAVPAHLFAQSRTWGAYVDMGEGAPEKTELMRVFDPPDGVSYDVERYHRYEVGRRLRMLDKVIKLLSEKVNAREAGKAARKSGRGSEAGGRDLIAA